MSTASCTDAGDRLAVLVWRHKLSVMEKTGGRMCDAPDCPYDSVSDRVFHAPPLLDCPTEPDPDPEPDPAPDPEEPTPKPEPKSEPGDAARAPTYDLDPENQRRGAPAPYLGYRPGDRASSSGAAGGGGASATARHSSSHGHGQQDVGSGKGKMEPQQPASLPLKSSLTAAALATEDEAVDAVAEALGEDLTPVDVTALMQDSAAPRLQPPGGAASAVGERGPAGPIIQKSYRPVKADLQSHGIFLADAAFFDAGSKRAGQARNVSSFQLAASSAMASKTLSKAQEDILEQHLQQMLQTRTVKHVACHRRGDAQW